MIAIVIASAIVSHCIILCFYGIAIAIDIAIAIVIAIAIAIVLIFIDYHMKCRPDSDLKCGPRVGRSMTLS